MLRALFLVLGFTGLTVLALAALSTPMPWAIPGLLGDAELRNKIGQCAAFAIMFETLNRTRVIPRSFFRCLSLKSEIGIDGAQERTASNAPSPDDIAISFKSKPGFGAIRTLEEIRGNRPA